MAVMLILFIYSTLIVYAIAAVGFIILSFGTVLSFVGLFLGLLVFLTFLYLHGLNTENDCLMLPFLVSEIIIRLLIAGLVLVSWICYLLSIFEQIDFKSPVGALTDTQFLLMTSVLITIIFSLLVRVYFPIYAEYRDIKKLNDRRRMEKESDEDAQYARLTFSARPTEL